MKLTRYGRMGDAQEREIVRELERWGRGELGSALTWGVLEDRFGFSRQSLNQKPSITAAFKLAKKALKGGLVRSREESDSEIGALRQEIERLNLEIAAYRQRETDWKLRWQRIAFHIRKEGVQVFQVDKPVVEGKLPSHTKAAQVLHIFDKEIPPSGRT